MEQEHHTAAIAAAAAAAPSAAARLHTKALVRPKLKALGCVKHSQTLLVKTV